MERVKKVSFGFLAVLGVLALLFLAVFSVAFLSDAGDTASAEIITGSTGFAPSRNPDRQYVYHLFRKETYELTPGTEIMYVKGTGLDNTMVVPEIPAGSATLKVTSGGKAYNTTNITCYVDVVERGNGFDSCPCGTLNENATEYNCCYGGIQHYKGAPFNYSTKTYYNTARVGVFNNNVAVTNATVKLFDGTDYFTLDNVGGGYYASDRIFIGMYEIVVNNQHTGKPLIIDKFTIGENSSFLPNNGFYSGNSYSENVYFYSMEVKTYLDNSLSNAPGDVYLKAGLTNCALTRASAGVYRVNYILTSSSVRENYSVIVGGRDTGYKLNDQLNSGFLNSVSIYYYTLSVTLNSDTAWTNARVELRNDDGEVRSLLAYKSTSGTSTLYTNFMQKDEASSPEKMTVYVDYVGTDAEIYSVRNGAQGSSGDKTFAALTYYDATINLRLDGAACTLAYPVTVSNGATSYSLTNATGTLSLRVRQIMSGNQELPYKVIVTGMTDSLAPLTITKTNKSITYNYRTVKFYTYTLSGTNYSAKVYRTQYVRQGGVPSLVSDPYVTGMTFDKWSLTTWSQNEDLDSITEYNFSTPITAAKNIYPHFAKTEVKINDSFVKCTVAGAQSSTGVAFRMANVTITGFEKGNNSIKSILLNLKNVETAYFYSTSGKTFKQGQNANLTSISGGLTANQSAVSITFNSKVSMATAQDYIRNNIVIKPIVNQDVEVTLTVSDGVLSTSATTSVSQSQWNGTAWTVKAAGTYSSWWIGSSQGVQYVYFTGNCTFNGNSNGWGGLEIYGTCYLYIPAGVTVTCNGVAGSGSTQGGAGIYLASGNTLYVLGNGTLVANGGRAGNGSNGEGGGGGWKSGSTYYSGGGGAGGAGGGGAGAGIGTHGAGGGGGGSGGSGGSVGWSSKGTAQFRGVAGSGGSAGGTPAAAGNLYKTSTVTVSAYGGGAGNNGSGGGAGGYQTDSGTGWKYNHCAAGGGGGGGGGGGCAGNGIGAGGAGGGGGGGGGSGACDYHSNTDYNCIGGGKGGAGGYGASGQGGGGGNAHCDHQDVPGGNGGGGGSIGSAGSSKSATSFSVGTGSNTKWSVTFTGATSNGTMYYTFESTSLTVPDYVPSGKNLFLGWKVATYARNAYGGAASRPLTTAESTLYQPGQTITTALGTYGNITFTAVTMPYEGKIAKDKLTVAKRYFASSNPTKPTYYTYSIQTYLDNVKSTVGTMVFTINGKNYKVESSASSAGLYSLTLEANVSTFTAKVDGVSISGTLNKGSNNVYFESMKVRITGHDSVSSVALSGSNAPVLKKDESASSGLTTVYSAIKQKGLDSNTYPIIVNGESIPTATGVAKFGTTVTIQYSQISATFDTNMDIETATLIYGEDHSVPMKNNNGTWRATVLLDSTTYTLYANGFDTKVSTVANAATKSVSGKLYEIKLYTRINGEVTTSVAKLTVNGRSTMMKTEVKLTKGPATETEYWSYVVTNNQAVTIESNGAQVTSVTPDSTLDKTYVDYFTVQYDAGSADGEAPVDNNLYLAGEEVTILSQDSLSTSNENAYLAGWRAGGNNYLQGDTTSITGPLVLTAVVADDLLKVHYVDHFGEFYVLSQLDVADKLTAYSGGKTLETLMDHGIGYTLKGWMLDIDESNTVYAPGEVTNFVVGDILGDSTEEVNVYFTAVYDVELLNEIHFELSYDEADDPNGTDIVTVGNVGDTFTIDYTVTINDGVHAMLLIPQFDTTVFKIKSATIDNTTVLGPGTMSGDPDVDTFKFAFEGLDLYDTTGNVLISVEYELIRTVAGKYEDFGFIVDYPTDTLSTTMDALSRSNAWYILQESEFVDHVEVAIFVDNHVTLIVQTPGTITIAEQTVVYHGESLTAGDVYTLATAYDQEATYYEFVAGEAVLAADVTEDNFTDKHYYVLNPQDDVFFDYSGFSQQVMCVNNEAVFTVKWYTRESGTDNYTEIAAPRYVGDYYVGVSATASDFLYAVNEVRQLIHIVKANVTYTIHDKTSVWSESLVSLTGEVTVGEVYEGDDLNVVLSTTATTDSAAGEYPITGVYDNDNYTVTFVDGGYTITKKQIELGLDATAKFLDDSFAYDGTEKTISVIINEFYADILSVSYSGGEQGCSGNGAIHVLFNEDSEVIGYTITALFAITQDYLGKCEFVTDANEDAINSLTATLTITIHGITEAEFLELVDTFVTFAVMDGETEHVLTPVGNAMAYGKTYDAVAEYAKVVVGLEANEVINDKLSALVTYKLDDQESVVFNASEAFDYSDYEVINANVYVVTITFAAGSGYAFEAEVDPVYTITMTISKQALTISATATVAYSDEAPVVTIDEGSNAWVNGESYVTYGVEDVQTLAYLVKSSYVQGDAAGSSFTLYWDDAVEAGEETKTALDVLSEILYNYDLTLTVADGLTVDKKAIDVDLYEFVGYSAIYDAASHALEITRQDEALTAADPFVSFTITREGVGKYSVRDVVDSDDYVATIALKDAANYVFADSLSEYWTLNESHTSASVTKEVAVAPAPLVVTVAYTKTIATFAVTEFVGNDDESVLTNFTFLLDGVACGNSLTATEAGEFELTASSDNTNYQFTHYTLGVYAVSFVSGPYDEAVAGVGILPQNMPETQYLFCGLDVDTFDVAEQTGLFMADEPTPDPSLRHYTFKWWSASTDTKAQYVFAETLVQDSITLYAIWQANPTYTITYKYKIDQGAGWNDLAADTFYSDDLLNADNIRSLEAKAWFFGNVWYYDETMYDKIPASLYLDDDVTVYGHYRFDVGAGDVDADGSVDVDDITLYRQWIVGGFEMTVINAGEEWNTVNDESFDPNGVYFLKRTADDNHDNNRDIRDVSIIRMATAGGYGWDILSAASVSGAEIARTAPVQSINAASLGLTNHGRIRLFDDVSSDAHELSFTSDSDIYVDLGGFDLTVRYLTLRTTGINATITILNGTINATNGITIAAPNGNVVINDVDAYVSGAPINLQAADNSLHFVGNVGFYHGIEGNAVPAVINIEEGTHVVLEQQAEVVFDKIIVTENNFADVVTSAEAAITIDNNTETEIDVEWNVVISDLAGLVAARTAGGSYVLGADITYAGQVCFGEDATLDLNGHTLRSTTDVALSVTDGKTLTIKGNGNVIAQEMCVMAFDGSTLIIEGGTYTAIDNAVFGTNGTAGRGGNTITINAGTFYGGIVTAGYVACGIYVANNDTVTVNGGTFNITDGVGILARSGNTTVNGGTFNVTGDGHLGKVGDSNVTVPSGEELVLDLKAGYPGGTPTLTESTEYEVYIVE